MSFGTPAEKNETCTKVISKTNSSITAGVLTSLSNPYWTLWWATIGLNLAVESSQDLKFGIAIFYIGHIMSDIVWFTLISTSIALSKKIISDKAFHFILTICGIVLIGFGVYFGLNGIKLIKDISGI